MKSNEKMKDIGAVGGEILASKAVLTYALKYEYQEIKMYCSHIKVADWIERGVHTDKLPVSSARSHRKNRIG